MAKVAWIGLGVMGTPMAGYLLTRGGHSVAVYNRTRAKAEAWVNAYAGGTHHATPAEAAKDADFVFACVGNDDDLREVTTGPHGAFATMRPGAIFVDHTTASADVARELFDTARAKGLAFVDAPVSGGQAGAEAGQLTVMCGGDAKAFDAADPVIRNYARAVRLMGPAGSGQLAKMVNQIAIGGLLQGLSEAIAFAENAGLDVAAVIDTISKGAAQSWQMENRWQSMHERRFDFGFAVDWMRKDLAICLAEAKRNGSTLAVTELVDRYYAEVQNIGGGRWDTSSLIARLPKTSGKN
ncbi:NAD(P)-dependent oxidoreductase [Hyphomicrobium sp.]|uniref:NAD(P)-dependent oxidoreductase n=1 Tax=Hyphomicrobium sp. TaxID=82 RepID=UPI002C4AB44B|nr:NAD(P)-dependent oxidoreductase [Hyphomicrobium sp.]HRN89866.1 NAD(P)-dependent oxidoreductase [Hyphomicrobium sp.]HRQ26903.1 NAD(P)-dependent oxidoreductase [Hyphomicrobium sp.]